MLRWSTSEIEVLSQQYPNGGYIACITFINRTRKAINAMAFKLGIKVKSEFLHEIQNTICRRTLINKSGSDNPNWKGGISTNNYRYKKIQIQRYPEKYIARNIVAQAIRSGKLKRCICESCGVDKTQAHHDDYTKPLEVRWLCKKCHDTWHRANTPNYYGYKK